MTRVANGHVDAAPKIAIRFDAEKFARLRMMAAERGISFSALIRELVDARLQQLQEKDEQ